MRPVHPLYTRLVVLKLEKAECYCLKSSFICLLHISLIIKLLAHSKLD